jgi:hypothetical protein
VNNRDKEAEGKRREEKRRRYKERLIWEKKTEIERK